MPRLQAVFYRLPDGSEPVDEYIDQLSVARQVVIDNQIDRLNLLSGEDPPLPFPFSSQVEDELRALRCLYGSELYRTFYRWSYNTPNTTPHLEARLLSWKPGIL